ncbi:hypothetical protein C5167_006389 [Papaver somniferum]|uniref:Uncharacterized protein n=1 Tax=Papaver somniferum TaxID=3469 RepID=A0A4Y7JHF1_PAPSO|nr:hypothetical protein C5167_006389 [Papaver somniferum]
MLFYDISCICWFKFDSALGYSPKQTGEAPVFAAIRKILTVEVDYHINYSVQPPSPALELVVLLAVKYCSFYTSVCRSDQYRCKRNYGNFMAYYQTYSKFQGSDFSFDALFGNLVNLQLLSFQEEETDFSKAIGKYDGKINGTLRIPSDKAKAAHFS